MLTYNYFPNEAPTIVLLSGHRSPLSFGVLGTAKAIEEQMNDIENDFRMVGRPGCERLGEHLNSPAELSKMAHFKGMKLTGGFKDVI